MDSKRFSHDAMPAAIDALDKLLQAGKSNDHDAYQKLMFLLGKSLGANLAKKLSYKTSCLVASTAEDADYLASGVIESLIESKVDVKIAVFWNNHYQLEKKGSIAPILNTYLEPGYETAKEVVMVKSIISGSCVVKTNLLKLISEKEDWENHVHVLAPVMHEQAESSLKEEFPENISKGFDFTYFRLDAEKTKGGEVVPGIGGEIYGLLGMEDQPARTGYTPKLVLKNMAMCH